MNIFYTDKDPKIAARNLCDKHVPKMLLESVQMLCTAYHDFTGHQDPNLYKPAYVNHPMNVWARQSFSNFMWLFSHAQEIAKEYTFRFKKLHKSETVLYAFKPIDGMSWHDEPTQIPQCMPDEYKHDDPIVAYRNYYIGDKMRFAKWEKGRNRPTWITIPMKEVN